MAVTSSTGNKPLRDKAVSRVFATHRPPHKATNVVMSVVNAIDFNAAWAAALVGYDVVIEILQFEVLHADRSFELGLEVDCLVDALFVVADAEDPAGKTLLRVLHDAPHPVLPVQVSLYIGSVGSSLERLLPAIIRTQARHISGIANMNDDVRLKIINEVSKPLCPSVVMLGMCVGVWNDEVAGHRTAT